MNLPPHLEAEHEAYRRGDHDLDPQRAIDFLAELVQRNEIPYDLQAEVKVVLDNDWVSTAGDVVTVPDIDTWTHRG